MKADIAVIGAGALGLSTALHCARRGRSVVVVDRAAAGSQASGRAAGLFKSVQPDQARTRLARRSIEIARRFEEWAGVPLDVQQPGSFLVARTARHKAFLQAELAQSRQWGISVRQAGLAELAERASYYHPSGTELAVWCPEDIYIEEPGRLVQAYLAADDVPLDLGHLQKLAGQISAEVPLAGRTPVAEHRGGLFTMSPDGRFLAGPVPDVPGLWVVTGCNGSGFSSSPALGEMLATWITEGAAPPGLDQFSPGRFGRLTDEALIEKGTWQYAHYYDPA